MAWPANPRDLKVGFAFGHTDAEDPTGLTYETVSPNEGDDGDPGPVLGSVRMSRGRVGNAGTTDPTRIETSLRDSDGEFSPRNVEGDHYGELLMGTPMQVAVDFGSGDVVLARAAQPDWNPRWDGPDINDRVPINAFGVLARLGEDDDVLSALRRTTAAESAVAGYLPVEGYDRPPDVVASAVPAVAAASLTINGADRVTWDGDRTLPGSLALPTLAGRVVSVLATADVSAAPSTGFGAAYWVRVSVNEADAIEINLGIASFSITLTDDSVLRLRFTQTASAGTITDEIEAQRVVGGSATVAATHNPTVADGWKFVYARFMQSGADVAVTIFLNGEQVATGTLSTVTLTSAAKFSGGASLGTAFTPPSTEAGRISFGHVVFLAGSSSAMDDAAEAIYSAGLGHPDESAADRITRTAAEAGIAVVVAAGTSSSMGPQLPDTTLGIWRDCESTDHGALYERRDGRPAYQPRSARYNLTPALELDFGTNQNTGPISDLLPFDDNRDLRNLITVTRRDGASVTREQVDGPKGTAAVGQKRLPVTLNLATDAQVPQHAGWLLRARTVDRPRYIIVIDLYANPGMADDVVACDIGSRITVSGAPTKHVGPDTLDLIIEGEELEFGADVGLVAWPCEPYQQYDIGTYQSTPIDESTKRYDTLGSTLTSQVVSGTATSLSVTIATGHRLWTLNSASWVGLQVEAAGVIWDVSSITGTSSPQTINVVQAPANGAVKTVPAGTQIRVAPQQRAVRGL